MSYVFLKEKTFFLGLSSNPENHLTKCFLVKFPTFVSGIKNFGFSSEILCCSKNSPRSLRVMSNPLLMLPHHYSIRNIYLMSSSVPNLSRSPFVCNLCLAEVRSRSMYIRHSFLCSGFSLSIFCSHQSNKISIDCVIFTKNFLFN